MTSRPKVVTFYTILVILGMLLTIAENLFTLFVPVSGFIKPNYTQAIISLILLIPQGIFIFKFYNLKKNCLTWLYIGLGLPIVAALISQQWIIAVIYAVFGWVLWDYISHKKFNGETIFK